MEPQRYPDGQEGRGSPEMPGASYSLWCGTCKRTVHTDADDLKVYSVSGWPRCCGEVMYCGPATGFDRHAADLPTTPLPRG